MAQVGPVSASASSNGLKAVAQKPYPRHIAIILDGNGRWAQQKGLSPRQGHEAGAKAVRKVVQQCLLHNISALTVSPPFSAIC